MTADKELHDLRALLLKAATNQADLAKEVATISKQVAQLADAFKMVAVRMNDIVDRQVIHDERLLRHDQAFHMNGLKTVDDKEKPK